MRPPIRTVLPYTTLFRSLDLDAHPVRAVGEPARHEEAQHVVAGRPVERRIARRVFERQLHPRSEEHTSELQSPCNLVCRLLLEKKKETIPRLMVWISVLV